MVAILSVQNNIFSGNGKEFKITSGGSNFGAQDPELSVCGFTSLLFSCFLFFLSCPVLGLLFCFPRPWRAVKLRATVRKDSCCVCGCEPCSVVTTQFDFVCFFRVPCFWCQDERRDLRDQWRMLDLVFTSMTLPCCFSLAEPETWQCILWLMTMGYLTSSVDLQTGRFFSRVRGN